MENIFQKKWSQEIFQRIQSEYPNISERLASLRLTQVKRRNFYHWKEEGLIDWVGSDEEDKRTWVRLNMYEFIWVRIIQSARDFGIPIGTLHELKAYMFGNVLTMYKEGGEATLRKLNEDEANRLKVLVDYMESHEEELRQSGEMMIISMLGSILHYCIFGQQQAAIVFYKDSSGYRFFPMLHPKDEVVSMEPAYELLKQTHLFLSLNALVNEFMEEPENLNNLSHWGFITSKEMKLILAIRSGEYDSIHIKGMNNEDFIIEGTKTEDVKLEQATRLQKIFGMKMYDEVTLKYRNDKHIYVKNTRRL
jgi:hypothetical protein